MPITISGSTGIAGVDGSASTPAVQGTDTNTGIVFPAADTVSITTGGVERMRVDSAGKVGIGTTSAGNQLDVVSAGSSQIRVKDGINATAYYDFGRDGTDGFFGFSGAQTTFSGYKWSVNAGSEVMRITNGGNVGIGTSSPGALLQLNRGSGAADIRLSVAGTLYGTAYASSSDMTINSITAIPLILGTNNTERMRINSSGNVGIGTSSPQSRLHVVGASAAPLPTGGDGLHLGAFGGYASMEFCGTTAAYLDFNKGDGTDFLGRVLYDTNNNNFVFYTNGNNERARIDSSGNLLVGTATQSNSALLTIASPASGISLSAIGRIYSLGTYNNTTASAANLVVALDGHFFRSTSSRKYKRDIQDATFGLSDVLALRPVTYKGNAEADGDTVFGGLIAEEVHTAGLTQFVQYAADGTPDALSYGNMVALCVKAIQELKADNDAMKERIATLEAK